MDRAAKQAAWPVGSKHAHDALTALIGDKRLTTASMDHAHSFVERVSHGNITTTEFHRYIARRVRTSERGSSGRKES